MRISHLIFLGLFFSLLLLPFCNDVFRFAAFQRHAENRVFTDSIRVYFRHFDVTAKNTEKYVEDNFSFRTPLLDLHRSLLLNVYKTSPFPDKMILGKKKRYFIAGDEVSAYFGELNFTAIELEKLKKEWKKRKTVFDSLGITAYILPAPTAMEIYSDELPDSFKRSKQDLRFQQLDSLFNRNFPNMFVNVSRELKQAKLLGKVYFDLDHHWTELGGFIAIKQLLTQMRATRFPNLDTSFLTDFSWRNDKKNRGYFADMLNNEQSEFFPVAKYMKDGAGFAENLPLNFNSDGIPDWERQFHYVNPRAKNKQKVLVIRDSFGMATCTFLSEAFSETVFINDGWRYGLNKSVLESYKPDVVVYVFYITHIRHMIEGEK